MFQRLKKVFGSNNAPDTAFTTDKEGSVRLETNVCADESAQPLSQFNPRDGQDNSMWRQTSAVSSCIQGKLGDKPWKLERAAASRNYIFGEEIRGRADIAVDREANIVIMNRPLKELLEKRAYALYTDSVETHAGPTLMEEMRWLALYPEIGWEKLPDLFWKRYAVMTNQRAQAIEWVTPGLADLLTSWPQPATGANVPFILMVMRGRAHLRMQLTPTGPDTLDHIRLVFTAAAQSALDVFSTRADDSAETLTK